MIWGVLPCDIWTALRVHSLGKSDNSWKTTPLPSTLALPEDEQMVQLEEAYARATVDGYAHVWSWARVGWTCHFYLHDHELSRSPPDESFIDMLKQNCCLSGPHFPPPAIVDVLQDYVTNYHKVRRLHLIVTLVDLWRPWKYNTARAREITDQLWRISHL